MQFGKNYTVFMYDTITTPKQKTVETKIVIPTDSTYRLRFANFVYNPTDVPGLDIFSFLRNANVVTNLKVTDVTDFIPGTYILKISKGNKIETRKLIKF